MVGPASRKFRAMTTYVIVKNTPPASTPYTAHTFTGRGLAQKWNGYNPSKDFLFSTATELADDHDYFKLKDVYETLGLTDPLASVMDLASAIYRWAVKAAVPYKKGLVMSDENTPATAVEAEEKRNLHAIKKTKKLTKEVIEPTVRTPKHKVYANDQVLVRKLEKPPIAEGSKRYRIMEALMGASTVGEALLAARQHGGGATDLDIAVQKGAVEVK